jgi:hypothetical protein
MLGARSADAASHRPGVPGHWPPTAAVGGGRWRRALFITQVNRVSHAPRPFHRMHDLPASPYRAYAKKERRETAIGIRVAGRRNSHSDRVRGTDFPGEIYGFLRESL